MSLVTTTNACLVLGDADFEEPVREPPVLTRDPAKFERLVPVDGQFDRASISLTAILRSRDAGQPLQATLLTNYGDLSPGGQPWDGNQSSRPIEPSPLGTEAVRPITLEWSPPDPNAETCYRVSMVVSHQFAQQDPLFWCPVDPTDVARLTWYVATCVDRAECSFDDCGVEPDGGFTYCPDDVIGALAEDDG